VDHPVTRLAGLGGGEQGRSAVMRVGTAFDQAEVDQVGDLRLTVDGSTQTAAANAEDRCGPSLHRLKSSIEPAHSITSGWTAWICAFKAWLARSSRTTSALSSAVAVRRVRCVTVAPKDVCTK
jgi:hypothetical protein